MVSVVTASHHLYIYVSSCYLFHCLLRSSDPQILYKLLNSLSSHLSEIGSNGVRRNPLGNGKSPFGHFCCCRRRISNQVCSLNLFLSLYMYVYINKRNLDHNHVECVVKGIYVWFDSEMDRFGCSLCCIMVKFVWVLLLWLVL